MKDKQTWGSNKVKFSDVTLPETTVEGDNVMVEKQPEKSEEVIENKPSNVVHEVVQNFDDIITVKRTSLNTVYSEFQGGDSIAFVLFATNVADERRIGLFYEHKESIDKDLTTAFYSSVGQIKDEEGLKNIVKDKAIELAGFEVTNDEIGYLGKMFVSENSNQFCHLFGVRVDKLKQKEKTTSNVKELQASVSWLTFKDMEHVEDWRSISIVTKKLMNQEFVMVGEK